MNQLDNNKLRFNSLLRLIGALIYNSHTLYPN